MTASFYGRLIADRVAKASPRELADGLAHGRRIRRADGTTYGSALPSAELAEALVQERRRPERAEMKTHVGTLGRPNTCRERRSVC